MTSVGNSGNNQSNDDNWKDPNEVEDDLINGREIDVRKAKQPQVPTLRVQYW